MSDLPPALKTACTSGDLTLTKTLYNNPTTTKPLAKTPALSQMAILSTKNAHFSILSYCFFEGYVMDSDNGNQSSDLLSLRLGLNRNISPASGQWSRR